MSPGASMYAGGQARARGNARARYHRPLNAQAFRREASGGRGAQGACRPGYALASARVRWRRMMRPASRTGNRPHRLSQGSPGAEAARGPHARTGYALVGAKKKNVARCERAGRNASERDARRRTRPTEQLAQGNQRGQRRAWRMPSGYATVAGRPRPAPGGDSAAAVSITSIAAPPIGGHPKSICCLP